MKKCREIWIEQVVAPRTWKIRQDVLYPNGSLKDVQIDNDFDGTHFAAYLGSEIVGVISVFREEDYFQFRKFAVLPIYQRRGIGVQLLTAVFEFCDRLAGRLLWCNARVDAMPFYEKFGMKSFGNPFVKENISYIRMEIKLK